jgi:hypothetical protein
MWRGNRKGLLQSVLKNEGRVYVGSPLRAKFFINCCTIPYPGDSSLANRPMSACLVAWRHLRSSAPTGLAVPSAKIDDSHVKA